MAASSRDLHVVWDLRGGWGVKEVVIKESIKKKSDGEIPRSKGVTALIALPL